MHNNLIFFISNILEVNQMKNEFICCWNLILNAKDSPAKSTCLVGDNSHFAEQMRNDMLSQPRFRCGIRHLQERTTLRVHMNYWVKLDLIQSLFLPARRRRYRGDGHGELQSRRRNYQPQILDMFPSSPTTSVLDRNDGNYNINHRPHRNLYEWPVQTV